MSTSFSCCFVALMRPDYVPHRFIYGFMNTSVKNHVVIDIAGLLISLIKIKGRAEVAHLCLKFNFIKGCS